MRNPLIAGTLSLLIPGLVLTSARSEEHTSEFQSHSDLVCRLLLEKKKNQGENAVRCWRAGREGRGGDTYLRRARHATDGRATLRWAEYSRATQPHYVALVVKMSST